MEMEGPGQIQETLRNYKGHDGLSYGEGWGGRSQRLYHVSDLNNWIFIIH